MFILQTNDPEVASSSDFSAPLRTAMAVWFGGRAIKVDTFENGDVVPLTDRREDRLDEQY